MSDNEANFMGLPVELRVEIYELAFAREETDARPVDAIYRRPRPKNHALCAVSKFIYNESRPTSLKARASNVAARQQALTHLDNDQRRTTTGYLLFKARSQYLCFKNSHPCAGSMCFMCESFDHQYCFDCGRNWVVASYCAHFKAKAPRMVIPDSDDKPDPDGMGHVLAALPRSHGQTEERTATGTYSRQSWSFCWWQRKYQKQRAIDIRCGVRKRAVKYFWQWFGDAKKAMFTDALLSKLEASDPKMIESEKIRKTIGAVRLTGRESMLSARSSGLRRVRIWLLSRGRGMVLGEQESLGLE